MHLAVTLLALTLGPAVAAEPGPDFQREIRPILTQHCFACHGPDERTRKAGLRLDRREAATAALESAAVAIVPQQPERSELVRRIESDDPAEVMPPPEARSPLSPAQKRLLRQWIASGAEFTGHWAYRPPVRPAVPVAAGEAWSRNEIDRFVLARLAGTALKPSPEADRTTLIRRLSLDLTGLPPSVEDVDAFLADERPDAYERLVDRLLASPHYGEKMAQEWLDLARFGDSSGYQDDGERPDWPYRDYVIGAFNAGMPFDRFTLENLAGDLLPGSTVSQKIASGFNRLHRHNEEGGSDPDEFQVVYAVDRANTTATTWMGLTLGCAQCHDHKYDPFSQREYYQFYAFFNSLQGEIVISKDGRNEPPQITVPGPEDKPQLDRLTAEIARLDTRIKTLEPAVGSAFAEWLKAAGEKGPASPAIDPGAIGGTVARTVRRAYYADTNLGTPLSLNNRISTKGRITIVRSVNNEVNVGHFSTEEGQGPILGVSIAEGPRFFAYLGLPDGTRVASPPIGAEHGVDYSWTLDYDPAGGADDPADADTVGEGLLSLTLSQGTERVGRVEVDLTAAQRAVPVRLDAFGLSFRGIADSDTPIDLFVDDVTYTIARDGSSRTERFARDPGWTAVGNQSGGHRFGYDPAASVEGRGIEELLAIAPDKRSPNQIARLRQHYISGHQPEFGQLVESLESNRAEREKLEKGLPRAFVWKEMDPPRPAHILARGDYRNRGEEVGRGVPAIFPPLPADGPANRLALARWLVRPDHPLTARVVVNRLWKQLFGAGLVRTPEDFGVRGEPPTHPELLDWLAVQLIEDGWSLKRLQQRILLSATYRQSSAVRPQARRLDPQNRFLARASRFRLTAEEIRDGALTASGLLTRRLGGPSVYPYQANHFYRDKEDDPGEWKWPLEPGSNLYRRGLYTFLRRTTPYPAFQTFDAPSRGECTVARTSTNTPVQALVTLNDPTYVEAARVVGERALKDGGPALDSKIRHAFRCVVSRGPTDAELTILRQLWDAGHERYRRDGQAARDVVSQGYAPRGNHDPAELAAFTAVAAALLNLDEAITRE